MNITTLLTAKPILSSTSITRLVNSLPLRRMPYSHSEVIAKIREVLGKEAGQYEDVQGYLDAVSRRRERPVYNLPHDKVVDVLLAMPFPVNSKVLSTAKALAAMREDHAVRQTLVQIAIAKTCKSTITKGQPMNLDQLFATPENTVCSTALAKLASTLRFGREPYGHGEILAKVRKVLGNKAEQYVSSGLYDNGHGGTATRRTYSLPQKEAVEVMLSFSPQISTQVLAARNLHELLIQPAVIQPKKEPIMKYPVPSLTISGEVITMSSLEMVSYINSTRKAGDAELRHDNFLPKVPKVLGKDAPKFLGSSCYQGNGSAQLSRTIYNFPKREAMLMAMSYSYELQAQVFDAWEAAEAAIVKPKQAVYALPDFTNPVLAARAWAEQFEAKVILSNEIKEAQPKIAFHDAVVADETTYSLASAAKILGFKPHEFNRVLRNAGYLMYTNVAYQSHVSKGFFSLQYNGYELATDSVGPATTRVTSKGIAYLQKSLTSEAF